MRHLKKVSNKHLGQLLVERGIINHEQIDIAVEYQREHGGLLGEALVVLKFATERDITQALTAQYGFPYLPLMNYDVDPDVIRVVPEHVCRKFCLIPIDKIGKSLTLAMANPLNVQASEDVELISGCAIQTFVSTATEIKQAIDKYYSSPQES
jgi:hypothetical protein